MVDRRMALMVLAFLCLSAPVAAQAMDYLARQQVEKALDLLVDRSSGVVHADDADAFMTNLGLAWPAANLPENAPDPFVPDEEAVIEMVDIRLLLAQIAVQAGARDHVALVRAQGDREHDVILLRGGLVSINDLLDLAQDSAAKDFVKRSADGILLLRPLAIWSDAGLTLQRGDRLILDRTSGSFIANLGWLDLSGGMIRSTYNANASEPAFRPFVMTAGQGRLTATAATFQALGFGASPVFGGVSIVNNGLEVPKFASFVADSFLTDVSTLAFVGTTGAVVSGNSVTASTGTAILVSLATNTVIVGNRLTAVTGGHAIRVTANATGVRVDGNLVSGPARAGIMIDRNSQDVTVSGNLVEGSLKTAIGVNQANCVTITGNIVGTNAGNGIGLSDTDGARVQDNAILFNNGSGVLLRDQTATAQVDLTGNVMIGNRDGIRGATPGNAIIAGNDLDGQLPRLFSGDLAPMTVDWLKQRRYPASLPLPSTSTAPCAGKGNG